MNLDLLILDEPTSALDVSVQAKIIGLLLGLKRQMRLSYILITHDLSVAKNISDRIAVMYLGMIVEEAQASVLFENPIHPYTKALISAIPVITEEEKLLLPAEIILDGEIPSPSNLPYTCPFFSRCQEKSSKCRENVCPDLREVEKGHQVRCSI